jgi:hypothetical protein
MEVVTSQRLNATEWKTMVTNMMARGATASDEEIRVIIEYLSKNVGRQ